MGTGPSYRFKRKDKSRPSRASRGDGSCARETTGSRNAETSTANFMRGELKLRVREGEVDGRLSTRRRVLIGGRARPLALPDMVTPQGHRGQWTLWNHAFKFIA